MGSYLSKRIYDTPGEGDGLRILVMRLWPRGVKRESVHLWLPELGPDRALLGSFREGKMGWGEFSGRYLEGLEGREAQHAIREVRKRAEDGDVTILCCCRDADRCHRTLFIDYLVERDGNR